MARGLWRLFLVGIRTLSAWPDASSGAYAERPSGYPSSSVTECQFVYAVVPVVAVSMVTMILIISIGNGTSTGSSTHNQSRKSKE